MDENFFAVGRYRFSKIRVGHPFEEFGIHKVRDDFDLFIDAVVGYCLFFQEPRHRRHTVAFFDAEFHDGKKTWFQSYQRDVGSVQCRNDAQVFVVEDLFCDIGACCVRDGIMCVDQIEFLKLCNLYHLACKGGSVEGKLEQRVRRHLHFVIKNVVHEPIQPHRHRIADEMDLMPSFRKSFTEFGGDDSAAAVCRVACNADFHWVILLTYNVQLIRLNFKIGAIDHREIS